MRIIFLRHGITQANKDRTFSSPDTKLSKDGYGLLDKSKDLLKKYDIKKVYTSELLRSKQTAEYLGYKDYTVDRRINEIDMGDFKGHSYDYVLNHYRNDLKNLKHQRLSLAYPNGESRLDVIKRVSDFMDQRQNEQGDILCISHGIAIKSSLFWVIKDLSNFDNFWIDNGSLTVFRIENDRRIIECVNAI